MIEGYIRFLLDGVIEDHYEVTKRDDGKYLILITKDFQRSEVKFGVWFYHKGGFVKSIFSNLKDHLPEGMVVVQVNEINVPNEWVDVSSGYLVSGGTYTVGDLTFNFTDGYDIQ
jgi:hypothetical protein